MEHINDNKPLPEDVRIFDYDATGAPLISFHGRIYGIHDTLPNGKWLCYDENFELQLVPAENVTRKYPDGTVATRDNLHPLH